MCYVCCTNYEPSRRNPKLANCDKRVFPDLHNFATDIGCVIQWTPIMCCKIMPNTATSALIAITSFTLLFFVYEWYFEYLIDILCVSDIFWFMKWYNISKIWSLEILHHFVLEWFFISIIYIYVCIWVCVWISYNA